MTRDYVAFLRGISNVSMQRFRVALERLGFTFVGSFGTSGNLMFCLSGEDATSLESRIGDAVGVDAFVRTRSELSAIVAHDPYVGREGAAVFLAKHPIEQSQRESLQDGGFEGEPPVVSGATVYFVHPTRRPGRKAIVDFERELGLRGTMRSSKVVARVLDKM